MLGKRTGIWNALSASFTKYRSMAAWEYKVITSGKGGFATPALLEKFLNDLGREEWEIVEFRAAPDNVLAFTGLVRRSTQRDWTLEDAAAAAARTEAEKLRAEFAAKFQGLSAAAASTAGQPQTPAALAAEEANEKHEFRRPVDTSRDFDPEAADDDKDEWDEIGTEEELPTFFDAMKPHMRRNQRGPGMAVGVDYLAKKWDLAEEDIKGALVECGFELPEDDDAKVVYVEYDGDLYWVNANRRGELWINTKEKPRPVFRTVKAERAQIEEEPKAEARPARAEHQPHRAPAKDDANAGEGAAPATEAKPPKAPVALPEGAALLDKVRPQMRRNRRGPGGSGSVGFLSRALRCGDADLLGALGTLGLVLPATPADKPVYVELGDEVWWLNRDQRGGIWVNGRERRPGETVASREADDAQAAGESPAAATNGGGESQVAAAEPTEAAAVPPPPVRDAVASVEPVAAPERAAGGAVLAGVRLLLKETRTGSVAGKVERVAGELGKSPDELTGALVAAGLKVPEKPREKPVFVEHGGEIFWFNRNAKGELWVNAKTSKYPEGGEGDAGGGERKARGGRGARGRGKSDAPAGEVNESAGDAGPEGAVDAAPEGAVDEGAGEGAEARAAEADGAARGA